MKYLSVCSGIEAATVAWHPLGWEPVGFSEIEPFPSAVLAHHYPKVPNHGDFTLIGAPSIDLLVGGTPRQSFSVAGLRGGLADDRGNLALEFCRLADRARPRWIVWENVPGVLSSSGGRDFGSILGALGELGYGVAYRVLDAQFYGVPQRRRRVFLVGCLGDWRRAAAVLFERESLRGNHRTRRAAGTEIARPLTASAGRSGGNTGDESGNIVVPFDETQITHAENRSRPEPGDPSPTLAKGARPPAIAFKPSHYTRGKDGAPSTAYPPLTADADKGDQDPVVLAYSVTPESGQGADLRAVEIDKANALDATSLSNATDRGVRIVHTDAVTQTLNARDAKGPGSYMNGSVQSVQSVQIVRGRVRRLTPRECERLQGFPDNYTNIPKASDSARYRALGNSMAVPCMRWIGERIARVDSIREAA